MADKRKTSQEISDPLIVNNEAKMCLNDWVITFGPPFSIDVKSSWKISMMLQVRKKVMKLST